MKKTSPTDKAAGIGDAAVRAKMGKGWEEWFTILDAAGAAQMNHTKIADYLYERQGCPGWWNEMVAVGYEQARGLRRKYEKPSGFEISRSKTIAAPVAAVYKAWDDRRARARWLKEDGLTVRKATPEKSMRITWADGETHLDVNFYPKGEGKSQVVVQYGKLASAGAAERMKDYWSEALERLKGALDA